MTMGPYWGNPFPGSYQPFPGLYGDGWASPPAWIPPAPGVTPPQEDAYQPQQPDDSEEQNPEKKSGWATFGKEVLKTGLTVGASVLGGIFGGLPGAIAAGAITSGAVSAIDQKASKGHVDWGSVAIDTVLGTIPGGVGTAVVRGGEKAIAKLGAKEFVKKVGERSLKRAAVEGAADGAVMGYASGALQSAYKEYKETGHVNFSKANQEGWQDVLPGLLGGAVAGGAFTGLGRHLKRKQEAKQYAASINEPIPEHLKDLTPPKMTFGNRLSAMFLQKKSEDPILGNFRKGDGQVLRGGMPESPVAFHRLRHEHNVRTIIDLRGLETSSPEHIQFEKAWAKEKGMRHVWIPMDSTKPPTQAQLQRFFAEIEQAKLTGGVYVHCKHGIDRTGSMMAAYDVSRGLKPEEAYKLMQENGYNFLHQRSRPAQKEFVLNGNLPETVRIAQAGVQVRQEAQHLLQKKVLNHDEMDLLDDLLNEGNITEAEKILAGKVPGRKPIFVEKPVEKAAEDGTVKPGDQFVKTTPEGTTPAASVSSTVPVASVPMKQPPEPPKPSAKKSVTIQTSNPPKPTDSGKPQKTTGSTTPASVTSMSGTSRVLTHRELFGENLANTHFRQQGNNTCYLLAPLDNILRQPDGRKILSKISFTRTATGYTVKFPGQAQVISISERELNQGGVSSTSLGVRLIERAYLKIPGVTPGAYDQPTRALERIFGWRAKESESISLHSDPNLKQFIGGVEFGYGERKAQLQAYLRKRPRETGHTDADIVTAISKNGGAHYYSVRLSDSTPTRIALADPMNTAGSVRRIGIDELLDNYHLEGIRIPVN